MRVKRTNHVNLAKNMRKIGRTKAKVGFFSSSIYEDGTPVAAVAIKNEFGEPQTNTPPRPFMRPAKLNNSDKWARLFGQYSTKAIVSGNVRKPFQIVGAVAQGDIKDAIKAVTRPPLKPATVEARLKGKKQGKSVSLTIAKPLVHTAYMLNSVQYEVS